MNNYMSDTQALELLNHNFKVLEGRIVARREDYSPSMEEQRAISYLYQERGYSYQVAESKPMTCINYRIFNADIAAGDVLLVDMTHEKGSTARLVFDTKVAGGFSLTARLKLQTDSIIDIGTKRYRVASVQASSDNQYTATCHPDVFLTDFEKDLAHVFEKHGICKDTVKTNHELAREVVPWILSSRLKKVVL